MTTRLKITRCEACETLVYKGRCPEEGNEIYHRAWDIVADTEDGRTWVWPEPFGDREMADRLAKEVARHGSINPEKWVDATEPARAPGELPDWATEAAARHPEYN